MADRLTQLQDCLDDLMTQMYASVRYIQNRHSLSLVDGQPDMTTYTLPGTSSSQMQAAATDGTFTNGEARSQTQRTNTTIASSDPTETPAGDPPDVFQAALRELAQDLILKEQQIEHLINNLPGIGNSEVDQERRIRELQGELGEVQRERDKAQDESERMADLIGQVIARVKRVR